MKNKSLFMTITILIIAMSSIAQLNGSFTDPRDGITYKTVKIGTQTWMAENLAYKAISWYWAADDDVSYVAKYGYLYNWEIAKTISPPGWHLPSDSEWTILINYIGGEDNAGKKLKATSGWKDYYNNVSGNGTNESGFTALPGGDHDPDGWMSFIGYDSYWWSSTKDGEDRVWHLNLNNKSPGANKDSYKYNKSRGFSVRCVRD